MRPSTSSAGDCYDNAMAESFFATLECELIARRSWRTRAEAKMALFDFLEGWYNPHRRHSALGYLGPNDFERAASARAGVPNHPRGRPPYPRDRAQSTFTGSRPSSPRRKPSTIHQIGVSPPPKAYRPNQNPREPGLGGQCLGAETKDENGREAMSHRPEEIRQVAEKQERKGWGEAREILMRTAQTLEDSTLEVEGTETPHELERMLDNEIDSCAGAPTDEEAKNRARTLEAAVKGVIGITDGSYWGRIIAFGEKVEMIEKFEKIATALEAAKAKAESWEEIAQRAEEAEASMRRTREQAEERREEAARLAAEIATYREAAERDEGERREHFGWIQETRAAAAQLQVEGRAGATSAKEALEQANVTLRALKDLQEEADITLRTTQAAGLSIAFQEKENRLGGEFLGRYIWPGGGALAVIAALGIVLYGLGSSTSEQASWSTMILIAWNRFLAVSILLGFAGYAGRKHEQWRKSYENYGHKRAVAASIMAFATQLTGKESEEEKRGFIREALAAITEHPELAGRKWRANEKRRWREKLGLKKTEAEEKLDEHSP